MKHLFCDVIGQTFYDGAKGGGREGREGVPAKEDPYCWIFTHKWHLSTSCQSEISRDMRAFLHDRGININVIGLANEDFAAMNIQQCGSLFHTLPTHPPTHPPSLLLPLPQERTEVGPVIVKICHFVLLEMMYCIYDKNHIYELSKDRFHFCLFCL